MQNMRHLQHRQNYELGAATPTFDSTTANLKTPKGTKHYCVGADVTSAVIRAPLYELSLAWRGEPMFLHI